jgi:hypothetical protein
MLKMCGDLVDINDSQAPLLETDRIARLLLDHVLRTCSALWTACQTPLGFVPLLTVYPGRLTGTALVSRALSPWLSSASFSCLENT